MSNSIINTANSKTVGSLSADANGALPESGDVFANLFQVLNGSAQGHDRPTKVVTSDGLSGVG